MIILKWLCITVHCGKSIIVLKEILQEKEDGRVGES